MIIRKTWRLYKPDATQIDARFIVGLGCAVEIITPEPIELIATDGSRWKVAKNSPQIEITTTCEKQEMMLKLKYGEELLLYQVFHTTPNTRTHIPGL